MIYPARYNELIIKRRVDFGAYLTDDKGTDEILLPAKEIPEGADIGSRVRVFVYKDSKDRPIATTMRPYLTMERPAVLTVKEVTRIGAFLDWGLPKDLLLPFREMRAKVKAGDEYLVRLYIDKSQRLAASMKGIYHELSASSPYNIGDEVSGRIYEFGHDFGTFVAVDDRYSAMIPAHEDVSGCRIGQVIPLRITGVKEDGKLDVTTRQKAYMQLDDDSEMILELIRSYAGVLPFTEKASSEVIARECALSKAAFKRAVGHLYKQRVITIGKDGVIRLV